MKLPFVSWMVLALAANMAAQSPSSAPVPVASLPPREALSAATVEKLARMQPLFDGKSLAGWIQAPLAPVRFAREDVTDLPALVKRLSGALDPVAAFIREQFDEGGSTALAAHAAGALGDREAISALLRNINRVVSANESVYDAARFSGVALRPETDRLRQQQPTSHHLARLNRLLLEDAFPQELARSPASAWVVKDGAMASTGAGRGAIYTEQDYTHYRLVFEVRQISGDHVPGVLIFCERPPAGELGRDALGAIQFQVPNGGHWDYRPGVNKAGEHFARPVRIRFDLQEWAQVELLVDAKTGAARMAVAQPVGTRAIENLRFHDSAAGRPGPIALQMHNARLFDEFRNLRIEIDPAEDRLLTVE